MSLPSTQKLCGAYVYLLFMIVALSAFTFTWIRLPETKGRTFDDIAEEFRGAEGIPLHDKIGFNTFTWTSFQQLLNQVIVMLLKGPVN